VNDTMDVDMDIEIEKEGVDHVMGKEKQCY